MIGWMYRGGGGGGGQGVTHRGGDGGGGGGDEGGTNAQCEAFEDGCLRMQPAAATCHIQRGRGVRDQGWWAQLSPHAARSCSSSHDTRHDTTPHVHAMRGRGHSLSVECGRGVRRSRRWSGGGVEVWRCEPWRREYTGRCVEEVGASWGDGRTGRCGRGWGLAG
jgi:hypothetical protein